MVSNPRPRKGDLPSCSPPEARRGYNAPMAAPDQGLPRDRRLRKKPEIDRAFRKGRSSSDDLLRVHAVRGRGEETRVAVSCPRRMGSSVARSRWKRLIREAFRLNRESLGPGMDLVVVPLKPPKGVKRQDVERSMIKAVERIRRRGL